MERQGYAAQGVSDRTDEQLVAQGYITYCAAEGDNKATWARSLAHGQKLGIPVWVFGYASTRQSDLKVFRQQWVEEFKEMKYASSLGKAHHVPLLNDPIGQIWYIC